MTKDEMTVQEVWTPGEMEEMFPYACMLSNEVHFDDEGKQVGDPTELALVRYAVSQGLSRSDAEKNIPFWKRSRSTLSACGCRPCTGMPGNTCC